jgi:hypothetical protein
MKDFAFDLEFKDENKYFFQVINSYTLPAWPLLSLAKLNGDIKGNVLIFLIILFLA